MELQRKSLKWKGTGAISENVLMENEQRRQSAFPLERFPLKFHSVALPLLTQQTHVLVVIRRIPGPAKISHCRYARLPSSYARLNSVISILLVLIFSLKESFVFHFLRIY